MCNFCNNILNKKEFLKIEDYDRPIASLIYNPEQKEYVIWHECDDFYYSRAILYDVKYCPKCGRKLNDE